MGGMNPAIFNALMQQQQTGGGDPGADAANGGDVTGAAPSPQATPPAPAPQVDPEMAAMQQSLALPPEVRQFMSQQLSMTPQDYYKQRLRQAMGMQDGQQAPTWKNRLRGFLSQLGYAAANARNADALPFDQMMQQGAQKDYALATQRMGLADQLEKAQAMMYPMMARINALNEKNAITEGHYKDLAGKYAGDLAAKNRQLDLNEQQNKIRQERADAWADLLKGKKTAQEFQNIILQQNAEMAKKGIPTTGEGRILYEFSRNPEMLDLFRKQQDAINKSRQQYNPIRFSEQLIPGLNAPMGFGGGAPGGGAPAAQQGEQGAQNAGTGNPMVDSLTHHSFTGRSYIDASKFAANIHVLPMITAMAQKAGLHVMTNPADVEAQQAVDRVRQQQRLMFGQILPYLPKNPGERPTVAAQNAIKSFLQSDSVLAAQKNFYPVAIDTLRAIAGSKNLRMTATEIQQSLNRDMIKPSDTVDTAVQKMRNIDQMLDNIEKVNFGDARPGSNNRPLQNTAPPPKPPRGNTGGIKILSITPVK